MRLHELIVESPETDVAAHSTAVKVYQTLTAAVMQAAKPDFEVEIGRHGSFLGYNPATVGFDRIGSSALCLLLGQKTHLGSEIGGSVMKFSTPMLGRFNRALVVYGLRSNAYSEPAALMQTSGFRVTFLHEFVHILDVNRTAGAILNRGASNASDQTGYFNDPAEFNAFTNEIAEPLLAIGRETASMDDAEKTEYLDLYGMTGDARVDIAKLMKRQGIHLRFLTTLRPERRKALLRRLYKLHRAVCSTGSSS